MSDSLENLMGTIERITFHNPETGFCILRLRVKGRSTIATVVGTAVSIHVGEAVELQGHWLQDSTYGLQFKAVNLRTLVPTTLVAIEKYLGSGMIKGIGPHFAKKLVSAFGVDTLEIIEHNPERLLELSGIGEKRQKQLLADWQAQKSIRDIMVFLQGCQISSARAVRIYKTYGDQAVAKLKENPYRLARDIYGIGFKTADTLAKQMGIPEDSPLRAEAGIQYVMQTLGNEGHCAVSVVTLQERAQTLLSLPTLVINSAIDLAVANKYLIQSECEGTTILALSNLYRAEVSVAKQMHKLLIGALPWAIQNADLLISQLELKTDFRLSDSQKSAILQGLKSKVFILTGGPGVGKTTIIKSLLIILQQTKTLRIMLCAPTGRAAKRLSETTGSLANTIHRLLNYDPKHFGFKYHQGNPLSLDLLIVDEASMLDIILMDHLLKALPTSAALLLIGDSDQLPSVGPGCVLTDLLKAQVIPSARLTEIFRQTQVSQIVINAHRVNQGKLPLPLSAAKELLSDFYFIEADSPAKIQDKILCLISDRIPKRFHLNAIQGIQVLTPMNRGAVGAQTLNGMIQAILNKQVGPRVEHFGHVFSIGDKVIQCTNNYDKAVFNGDIGYISHVDLKATHLQINFEGKIKDYHFNELDELSLAYALSIHKSQGSEYPAVIIPLSMQHYRMLTRNLLYTAITRGKQLVILVGQKKALSIAVHTTQDAQRLTQLKQRLQEYF